MILSSKKKTYDVTDLSYDATGLPSGDHSLESFHNLLYSAVPAMHRL